MMLGFEPSCICPSSDLPFQRQSRTAWLPSPTRLMPGQQTEACSHFSHLGLFYFYFPTWPRPSGSPFHWSPELLRLSSQGPWRPASPLCTTGGHPRPRTPCWRRNRRSWRGRRRPAAGWTAWCPCGWSCGSALGERQSKKAPMKTMGKQGGASEVGLTVLDTQDHVSEVETSLLLCERCVRRHLHHRAARQEKTEEEI